MNCTNCTLSTPLESVYLIQLQNYADIKIAKIHALWSVNCLFLFMWFCLGSILVFVFFFWIERNERKAGCDISLFQSKLYVGWSLLTFYTLFLGGFFGASAFHGVYFICLLMPLYMLYLYRYSPLEFMLFSLSANNLFLILYGVFLVFSLIYSYSQLIGLVAHLVTLESQSGAIEAHQAVMQGNIVVFPSVEPGAGGEKAEIPAPLEQ